MIKFLNLHKEIPVNFLCSYFSVNRSSFYYWNKINTSMAFHSKKRICDEIKIIFKESRKTYGSPRIFQELKKRKIQVCENTVAKYMNEMGLDARYKKKFKVQTTDSNHNNPIAPRVFKTEDIDTFPNEPGKLLAGDITYLKTKSGFVYLAVVLDLFNREVVGWSMGDNLETTIVLDALDSAMRKVGPDAEVIFHSDRGSQYASDAYRKFLKNKNIKPSMSRKGNCYDNAYVESWFASLKKDEIYRKDFKCKENIKSSVFEYIEVWYNKKRSHSSLGYLSPVEYKQRTKLA